MITKRLLLLLLLWPFLMWSQSNIIRWNKSNLVPNVDASSAIANNPITVSSTSGTPSISYTNWSETFFMVSGVSYSSSLNVSNYVQFKVSPKSNNEIEANSINFQYRSQGNTVKFQVRASKDVSFNNYFVISNEVIANTNWNTFDQSLTATGVVKPGEILYIRVYIYGNNDNFHFKCATGSGVNDGVGPTVTGTYANINNTAPVVADDSFSTTVNNSKILDVLNNDSYPSLTGINISTAAAHGSATVNGLNSITYTPDLDYIGTDTFKYTLKNGKGTSSEATVTINVTQDASKVLVRWEGSNSGTVTSPTYYNTGIISNSFSTSSNLSVSGGYDLFGVGNWGGSGSAINKAYYIQYDIKANAGYQIKLDKFNFTPWVWDGSPQYYKVFYSKTGSFSGEQVALQKTDGTLEGNISASQSVQTWVFPSGFTLYPSEKITIRVYAYNPTNVYWSYMYLGYANKGTSFEGMVQNVTRCTNTVTWNGAWSSTPNANSAVIIDADYSGNSFDACSITVNPGKKIIVGANKTVNISYNIVNNGVIQVESDGNLVQTHNGYNSGATLGTVLVKRDANLKKSDYNYWGAPVAGQNLKSFSPNTLSNRFYTYNEANDMFSAIDPVANSFSAGTGYAIRSANNLTSTTVVVSGEFTGTPNNGDVVVPVKKTGNGFNLVANPYPSNVDIEKFFQENSTNLVKVAYFWTNLNPNPAMQGASYPNGGAVNNYAIYNGMGGVPAAGAASRTSATPTQYLKVAQGFIVQSKVPGTTNVVFKNSMRTGSTNSNFFNRTTSKTSTEESVDRFWLQLTTPLDVENVILVGYKKDATNDYEVDYDAPLLVVGSDSFYSVLDNKKLAIQGRKYPLVKDDVIPLGASFYADGTYTISVKNKEGIFSSSQPIYLRDNTTGVITNLSENDYSFSATKGQSTGRFDILYTNGTLATDANAKKQLVVYQSEGFVNIDSPENMNKIFMFDASGKLVYQNNVSGKSAQINAAKFTSGVYMVNIETVNGKQTKKILIK